MDLRYDENQKQLVHAVAGFLARHFDIALRRDVLAAPVGDLRLWRLLSQELGLTGLMIPTEHGGHGGSAIDAMIVMEAFGRRLTLDAFAEHCIVAPGMLCAAGESRLIATIVSGEARVALGFAEAGFRSTAPLPSARGSGKRHRIDGQIKMVVGGPCATHFLFSADCDGALALFLVTADSQGISRENYRMLDGRGASDLRFADVGDVAMLAFGDAASALLRRADGQGVAAVCAEAVGVMREMIDITIAFVGQRRQFGAPVGSFQVVQHKIVDMALVLEKAVAITLRATLALDGDAGECAHIGAAAKLVVAEALRIVGQSAIQLHGGVGTTEESSISHYFRRGVVIEGQFGSAAQNLERYAAVFARL